jgi:hypothetical protein
MESKVQVGRLSALPAHRRPSFEVSSILAGWNVGGAGLTVPLVSQQTWTMFKMIGGDGHEYGPVTAEQLRQWIADQRANGQTLVQAEGSTQWKPLAALPEFADALAAAEPSGARALPGPPAGVAEPPGEARVEDYRLNVSSCVMRGCRLVGRHFLLLTASAALVWLVVTGGALTSAWGAWLGLVVAGALHGGLMLLFLRLIRQQPARMADLFACFGAGFFQLMLVWILTQFVSAVAMLLIVPGIYLKVVWVFSLTLAADRQLGFWRAMELSRKVVSRHWFAVAAVMLLAYLPLILFVFYSTYETVGYGLRTFGETLMSGSWAQFMEKFRQVARFANRLALQQQLVLLFNLPIAYAILMHAYEDIFGPRRVEADR